MSSNISIMTMNYNTLIYVPEQLYCHDNYNKKFDRHKPNLMTIT